MSDSSNITPNTQEKKWIEVNNASQENKNGILRNYLSEPAESEVVESSDNLNAVDNNIDIKYNIIKQDNDINIQYDTFKQDNDNEDDDDWRNDSFERNSVHDYYSDDSTDLLSRKLKLEQTENEIKDESKSKNAGKKTTRRSAANRERLKKFLEERAEDGEGTSCKYCGCAYTNIGWLVRHEEKCNLQKQAKGYKCSCCNSIFINKEECATHQRFEHADMLTCKKCDRIFANPDSVKAHTNFYHDGVPRKVYLYICEKCGKVFKQKALLLTHEQSNCGDGPLYQCTVCNKSFTSKHVQKSHMRIHAPEKSLLCKFCGKSFHWKGQLKIHERSHTGERPFKCMHCPKAFSYRESLITHSTLHTGIKPHLCEACGSRFSCIGNLLKHRRTHATTCGMVTRVKTEQYVLST